MDVPCTPEVGDAYIDASSGEVWKLTEDGWVNVGTNPPWGSVHVVWEADSV